MSGGTSATTRRARRKASPLMSAITKLVIARIAAAPILQKFAKTTENRAGKRKEKENERKQNKQKGMQWQKGVDV